jgi:hypothetical protein
MKIANVTIACVVLNVAIAAALATEARAASSSPV